MKITIHRGIDQIGGCITEIATDKNRILIDLGQNLPDNKGMVDDYLQSKGAVESLCNGIDAICYTHYHGDHLGHFHNVPNTIQQYIGATAQKIVARKYRQLSYLPALEAEMELAIEKVEKMLPLTEKVAVSIGDIKITPYLVSHSAYESFLFLIEADGKRILHTGDFRDHGYLGKGLMSTIKSYLQGIDVLIIEGTMTSRLGEEVKREQQIQAETKELMSRYKNLFVLCSSTDMERLAGFKAANTGRGRPLVADGFQRDILEIFTEAASAKSKMWNFGTVYEFRKENQKLIDWMIDKGFCMFVRPTDKFNDYLDFLLPKLNPAETLLIYSMWKEYVNPHSHTHQKEEYLQFLSRFDKVEKLHTSGHASVKCLIDVCFQVNPTRAIIPIHSERSDNFRNLPLPLHLKNKIVTESQDAEWGMIIINTKV